MTDDQRKPADAEKGSDANRVSEDFPKAVLHVVSPLVCRGREAPVVSASRDWRNTWQ